MVSLFFFHLTAVVIVLFTALTTIAVCCCCWWWWYIFSINGACHYQKFQYTTISLVNTFTENPNWKLWFGLLRKELLNFVMEYFKYFNFANKNEHFWLIQKMTRTVEICLFFERFYAQWSTVYTMISSVWYFCIGNNLKQELVGAYTNQANIY